MSRQHGTLRAVRLRVRCLAYPASYLLPALPLPCATICLYMPLLLQAAEGGQEGLTTAPTSMCCLLWRRAGQASSSTSPRRAQHLFIVRGGARLRHNARRHANIG